MGARSLLFHPPRVNLFNASSLSPSLVREPHMTHWLESPTHPLCIAFETISYKAMSNNSPKGRGETWSQAILEA
ncbi:BQ2448_1092 [Microbotryum intermedium]|uniref:BQ2448_1092 protein n=1 Tax=Microbotryum intermedium TaxID=269621 RepID=A0A238FEZ1_9BASI|nr:BQ2448_1092 [Microbotryum intermedium]